jgi:PAS domain S-box-containing protein/putative nucleotidyltransferase with HDIG domain
MKKTKVLIVDDNQQDLYLLQVLLHANGYKVVTASNGLEALEKARAERPDMIIADILMPVMDGFQLCREWKRDDELKEIPFVFYSATYTGPEDQEFALNLGAARFIVKPMEPDVFVGILREVIKECEEGRLVPPMEPIEEEPVYLKEYSERLVKKLEDKMLQLEEVNRALERDIAERKRAEEEIRRLKEFNEGIVQSMAEGIAVEDADGYFTFVNPAAATLLGYTPEELLGQHWTAIIPPDQHPIVQAADERRARGETDRYELQLIRKDGTRVPVLVSGSPRFEEGRFAGTLAVFTDITERKRTERLLRALNEAALAMERALTHEEIFAAVAEEFKKLGFSCMLFPTDESQKRLFPRYLSYEDGALKAVEKLVGLKAEDFSIPIKNVDLYKEVVWEKKAVFVGNAEEVMRQLLPDPAKKFIGQIVRTLKVPKSISVPLIVEDKVIGVLSVQSDDLTEDDIPAITAFANQMAAAWRKARLMQELKRSLAEVKRAQEELQQSYVKLQRTLEGTVHTLVSAIEMRDPYTAGHQRRVTQLACAIAKEMGLPQEQIEGLRMAGLIHDLGKITVPAEILSRPGPLSDLEYSIIKAHAQIGHDILKTTEFPCPVAQIVLQHHERMDGSGYPQGLLGEEIILEARILGVADVVEAMASHRPYRPARGLDKALEEISQNNGVLYDPEVVDACLKLFTEKGFEFE